MSVVPDGLSEDGQTDVVGMVQMLIGPLICGESDSSIEVWRGLLKVRVFSRLRGRGNAPACAGVVLRAAQVQQQPRFFRVGDASPLREGDIHGFD